MHIVACDKVSLTRTHTYMKYKLQISRAYKIGLIIQSLAVKTQKGQDYNNLTNTEKIFSHETRLFCHSFVSVFCRG